MKTLAKIIGGFLACLLAVIILVPFVVNVDKYRPEITDAVNQQINGKLQLGKLSLSLWGQIRVEVGGLQLTDSEGNTVVTVKDAYFHVPLFPLLKGSPVLTFKMKQPQVNVVKNKAGHLNLLSLQKASPQETAPQASGAPPSSSSRSPALPGIATRARLGMELENAYLNYRDEATGFVSQVHDLNVMIRDLSLSHPTELEVWANLYTRLGKTFLMKGPVLLTGSAQPLSQDGKMERVDLKMKLDLSDLELIAPGTFEKKRGLPFEATLTASASEHQVKIEDLTARFFNAEIKAQGRITPESTLIKVKSNEIQFKPWADLVPLLKQLELGGSLQLQGEASGPNQKMSYQAEAVVEGFTAKAPRLKAQPRIDARVHVSTDQVDKILLTLEAPGSDLKVEGKVISFTKPKVDLKMTSSSMDLDQWVEFPPPPPAPSTPAAPTKNETASAKSSAADYDALLDDLRENKTLGSLVLSLFMDMKMLKAKNVKMTDLVCKLGFESLTASIDPCGFKIFSGGIHMGALTHLKPKKPDYRFNAKVEGLNISQAVNSQMELFKNTLTGIAHFNMTGEGVSFNAEPAMLNLKAKGNLRVDQAEFATVDVTKMVTDALNKALSQIGDKVPAAKGKSVPSMQGRGSKYEFISSDFTIAGGKFSAPTFYAKALPNQGIDLKGNTQVGLADKSLNAQWDVIDTYNLTRARDLSVEQNGIKVEHILAEGSSPVHFPITAGCTIQAPCFKYTEVPEFLAKVALGNIGHAVEGRAKEEARKRAGALIQQAPPQIQDKLKGLFH